MHFMSMVHFKTKTMKTFLSPDDVEIRLVPPRRHCNYAIEPRQCMIRSVFLRLQHGKPTVIDALHSIRSICIYNDLYVSDTVSAYEMAKGFTKSLCISQRPIPIEEKLRR